MREYLETRTDKQISSNSLCDVSSIILKNNSFDNEELKYHQKRGFAIGTKREFFKTVSLNLSCGYDTLVNFFVYRPKVPKTETGFLIV